MAESLLLGWLLPELLVVMRFGCELLLPASPLAAIDDETVTQILNILNCLHTVRFCVPLFDIPPKLCVNTRNLLNQKVGNKKLPFDGS